MQNEFLATVAALAQPRAEPATRGRTVATAVVIGTSAIALALAAGLAGSGVTTLVTSLHSRDLRPLADGLTVQGGPHAGRAPVRAVALDDAVDGADVVFLHSHATAHPMWAGLLAPLLRSGQVVVLVPGRSLGAFEFAAELRRHGCRADILLGEAQTQPHLATAAGPGVINWLGTKDVTCVGALPAHRSAELAATLAAHVPGVVAAPSALWTGMQNVGGVLHPAAVLLNVTITERAAGGDDRITFYGDQISETLCRDVLEPLDAERLAVGGALGLTDLWTAREWVCRTYGVEGDTLARALRAVPAYRGVPAARSIDDYGFVSDEVPSSLVPAASLGRALGVATPATDAIIDLAGVVARADFRATGRTLARLGIDGTPASHLRAVLESGPDGR